MRRWGIWLVIVAALWGGVFSAVALRHYVRLSSVGLAVSSFCNINEQFNCDIVALSSYAAVRDIPVAGVGLLFFALQLLFGGWALMQREAARGPAAFGLVLAWGGLAPVFYLGYVMVAILATYCLSCFAMDLGVVGIIVGWLVSGIAQVRVLRERQVALAPLVTTIIMGAVGGLFLANLGLATEGAKTPPAELIQRVLAMHYQQPAQQVDFAAGKHPTWGSATPRVQILEFSDFQCPFCREAALRVKPYVAEFRDQVQVVFFHYPLDQSCNTDLQRNMHPIACLAARAGVCAQREGKFWAFHDHVFRHQPQITPDFLLQTAAQLGLDAARFQACLDDPATEAQVQEDLNVGRALHVAGTPAIFLNGRPVAQGWQHKDILRALVKAELARHEHH